MALCLISSGLSYTLRPNLSLDGHNFLQHQKPVSKGRSKTLITTCCTTNSTTTAAKSTTAPIVRRNGNYEPSIWQDEFIQSITSEYTAEKYEKKTHDMKEVVAMMIKEVEKENQLKTTLKLIDDLQRLGVSYHFEDKIGQVLRMVYNNYFASHEKWNKLDLFEKSLGFRLLRQHGYLVSQEILNDFKNDVGEFDENKCNDITEILNLYEASYLLVENESMLDEARDFTTKYLRKCLTEKGPQMDAYNSQMISHALEFPLHWGVRRIEARWFIQVYAKRRDMNSILLEFAILDFNMLQAIYQKDLKYVSRWWQSTCWGEKLSFARDRVMEDLLWAIATNDDPQLSMIRQANGKVTALISVIDDVYDVYGTLNELEQFTDETNRWDINTMEEHPTYMKICFLGFYNSINEMAYEMLIKQDILITPYVKKAWADLCEAYLIEAKWYNDHYMPTFKEYMDNSWISITIPLGLIHICCLSQNISKEVLQYIVTYPDIVRYSGMIVRLHDDLGTSMDEMKRGDTPKSIQCYMNETGVSEEIAREHIKNLISELWKKLNKQLFVDSPFPQSLTEAAFNFPRMAKYMYQHGDGHSSQGYETQVLVNSLILNPIQGV